MRKRLFLNALIIIFTAVSLGAFEESMVIGNEDGWSSLVMLDGVVLKSGWEGFSDIVLADGEYSLSGAALETDLLLHFNYPEENPVGRSYEIDRVSEPENFPGISGMEKVLGDGALAFQWEKSALFIQPDERAVFARGSRPEDFTIEFWLYPARMSEGESIFDWEGGWWDDGDLLAQGITCMVADQKLLWNFKNFFLPPGGAETLFSLRGETVLLPRKWHHHLVRYDSISGLLEYLIDGEPEAVIFTTPSEMEEGEIYLPVCGSLADTRIQLGKGFIGLMDELRLSARWIEEPELDRFAGTQGAVVTRVFDLLQSDTEVLTVNARKSTPGNSDIYFYYRISDDLFGADNDELPWREFSAGESFTDDVSGRFIQLRTELLPDGNGETSPSVSSIEIVYRSKLPPLPPAYVTAFPGNGSVLLKWNAMSNAESRGFKVFYGEKPGVYFGTSSSSGTGDSPVDVGNRTEYLVDGLENGRLYYFTVMAYTGKNGDLTSEFSSEVSARPSSLHRIP